MTEQPSYDPDPETNQIVTDAIERLAEHVEHVLGSDPGCGQCLWCSTCQVRIIATDLLSDVLDQGWFRHARCGNDPSGHTSWPTPAMLAAREARRAGRTQPTAPPLQLQLLGRTPRSAR